MNAGSNSPRSGDRVSKEPRAGAAARQGEPRREPPRRRSTGRPSPFEILDHAIPPGERQRLSLAIGSLPTRTQLELPLSVLHGTKPGPRLWLSAGLHGDELNGVEIIRRVVELTDPLQLRGTLVAIPVVNVLGFVQGTRYLPDRRDLNRCFPGSKSGSLGARIAYRFMNDVVKRCTHGIDFHTGSDARYNYPQIRANLDDPSTLRMAQSFGAPVMIHAQTRDGSLREATSRLQIPVLLYEAGEAQRFCEFSIDVGIKGTLRVMRELGMLRGKVGASTGAVARKTTWVRARVAGILRLHTREGNRVKTGDALGVIGDMFGEGESVVRARTDGIVIGLTRYPVVHRGDAIVHIATPSEPNTSTMG